MASKETDDDNDVQMTGPSVVKVTPPANDQPDHNPTSSIPQDAESKMEDEDIDESMLAPTGFTDPFSVVQDAMGKFLDEMTAADLKSKELYQQHLDRQKQLMRQFVADSLRSMHEFNCQLDPIHDVLRSLKKPLEDVLLNKFVGISCDDLERITRERKGISSQSHRGYHMMQNASWGVAPNVHQYNQRNNISENPHLKHMDLGAEIKSLRTKQPEQNNGNNGNDQNNQSDQNNEEVANGGGGDVNNEEEEDSPMTDQNDQPAADNEAAPNNTQVQPEVQSNAEPVLSDPEEVLRKERDMYTQSILGYLSNINNITHSQKDLVFNFFAKIRAEQQRLIREQEEKIRAQQAEQQRKEQREAGAAMLISVVPWLVLDQAKVIMHMKSDIIDEATNYCMSTDPMDIYPAINAFKLSHPEEYGDGFQNQNRNHNNNNSNSSDLPSLGQIGGRSKLNKRVLNRSASTGCIKQVVFRCQAIGDDGTVTLQAVLDRNEIPVDPQSAKLLHLSVMNMMQCAQFCIVEPEIVQSATTDRVFRIVFQCHSEHGNKEWVPISIEPRCRDTEYEFKFDDRRAAPCNTSLQSVSHRIDGPVLFQGLYDDGKGLAVVGAALNDPIDIYCQVIDDVTHNIVMILFEHDLRENVVVDVKNISFTDRTLQNVVDESKAEFGQEDAAGNRISYRIVVQNKQIIAVLTKLGGQIKEMPYIEHKWLTEGALVTIPNQNMLGLIKCIPTGLIVTNSMDGVTDKKAISFQRNMASSIFKKHPADLDGFIDIEVVRINGEWRDPDDPLCQSFAVTDLKESDEDDQAMFMSMRESIVDNTKGELNTLMERVEEELNNIKGKKGKEIGKSPKEMLDSVVSTVKSIQELLAKFRSKKKMDGQDVQFAKGVDTKMAKWNREIRGLRFEIKMNG